MKIYFSTILICLFLGIAYSQPKTEFNLDLFKASIDRHYPDNKPVDTFSTNSIGLYIDSSLTSGDYILDPIKYYPFYETDSIKFMEQGQTELSLPESKKSKFYVFCLHYRSKKDKKLEGTLIAYGRMIKVGAAPTDWITKLEPNHKGLQINNLYYTDISTCRYKNRYSGIIDFIIDPYFNTFALDEQDTIEIRREYLDHREDRLCVSPVGNRVISVNLERELLKSGPFLFINIYSKRKKSLLGKWIVVIV